MSTEPRPFPPGPFVTDKRWPDNVFCDDSLGTVVAICTPAPDFRMIRYDGSTVAERIAKCLTACEGMDDPAAEIARLRSELAEATATLANERGEGEPPVAGWTFTDCGGWGMCWVFGGGADKWIAVTPEPAAGWYVRLGSAHMALHAQIGRISYPTAREAMRAASEALTPKEP